MKGIRTTFALAIAVLAIGVPTAVATPDGYQPQLQTDRDQPDAFMRALRNAPDESDVFTRYVRNHATAAGAGVPAAHPDSRAIRPSPGVLRDVAIREGGLDWTTGGLGLGVGLLLAALVVGTAFATRGRRDRLALR